MNQDEVIRYLIKRLAYHKGSATEIDYGRIEELCFLIQAALTNFKLPEE